MPLPFAIILAGGQSRRMGSGDKALLELTGRPLLSHVIDRLSPQVGGVSAVALNANGDAGRFAAFGLPVIADTVPGFAGPLAGVLSGLDWAAERGARHIVTAAADTPFLPDSLVQRLLTAAEAAKTPLACAATKGRDHPTFGLWPVALAKNLRHALTEEGVRKIVAWTDRHGCARANFDDLITDGSAGDPFFNVNTPEDMEEARRAAQLGR